MNKILAKYEKSKYSIDKHLTINIDGKSLDKIISENYTNENFEGFVPTLLDWLEDPEERRLVWKRLLDKKEINIVPILMCPDDLDLHCSVIVVEIKKTDEKIIWSRVGLDIGKYKYDEMPFSIGKEVEWFDKIDSFEFSLNDYWLFINKFKELIDLDEFKQPIKEAVNIWINDITESKKLPKEINSFTFKLLENFNEYYLYIESYILNSTKLLNINNTKENKLNIGKIPENMDYIDLLEAVKEGIEYTLQQYSSSTIIHNAEIIKFDDNNGKVFIIKKK